MAIELSQKSYKESGSSLAANIFFGISIAFLVLSAGSYFYLQSLNNDANAEFANADQQISQMRSEEVKNTEKNILAWAQKIRDYNIIFKSHAAPSNVLTLLENGTHPKIKWDTFEFVSASSNGASSIILKGTTSDFISLQQQILIFSKDSSVQNMKLTNIDLTKDGKIKFGLNVFLSSGVLAQKAE